MNKPDRFVDAHAHFWQLSKGWYPLVEAQEYDPNADEWDYGDNSKIMGIDFMIPDYLKVSQGFNVEKIVHVANATGAPSWVHETVFMQQLSDSQAIPIAIVGEVKLEATLSQIAAELMNHAESPNFRGIRSIFGLDYSSELAFGLMNILQELGLSYDLVANEETLPAAAKLAQANPDMSFVLNHTGWPTSLDASVFGPWEEGMKALADSTNTFCKISGLGLSKHDWTLADIKPWVEAALDIFGTKRCMFASNFPADWIYSEYDRLMNAYLTITSAFSQDDLEALYATNAESVYRF